VSGGAPSGPRILQLWRRLSCPFFQEKGKKEKREKNGSEKKSKKPRKFEKKSKKSLHKS
jgi:hypothetical protein